MAEPDDAKDVTFVVSGQALPSGQPSTVASGRVRGAASVGARRGAGETVRLSATPGQDVVLLYIANGPTLFLHPEDARDLMLAQAAGGSPSRGGPAAPGGTIAVPAELAWPQIEAGMPGVQRGKTRGPLGRVWLRMVEVVTGPLSGKVADAVASRITEKVDSQVETGLYKLSPDALPRLKGSGLRVAKAAARAGNPPLLVLLHGTFVDSTSTFGKFWQQHPRRVRALFERYGADGVYAFDHRTLGDSPVANALALAQSLPADARLHVVTHSRGGLVGEVLVRACAAAAAAGNEADPFGAPGYEGHSQDLKALLALVKQQRISVDRVVRVACPARGTLLASKRLSAYLSILKWGLETAAIPVAPQLVDFLTEVAQRREDPEKIPGLAAMVPDNPVVQWLNGPAEAVAGGLRVVAGDMQGDSIMSWLKTLLSDAFYWTDNDLVVQTRSMYGGVPRLSTADGKGGASFLLDQGGGVNHFNYFSNEQTADAITRALLDDDPAGFRPIGPKSWAGDDAGGLRAPRRSPRNPAELPALFVLPGILGSHLKLDGKRIWLGWRFFNSLKSLAWDEPQGTVEPDGPIGLIYDKLIDHFGDSHDVRPFGYDWRRPLEDEAQRLAEEISAALDARAQSQQPVRIVAHSMGGLLARTMKLERPDVWQRMMARDGARFLMLGTPNGGSWAPMQVLSGDDQFGNTLVATGALFDGIGARKMMAAMPGFIQLQAALLEPGQGLGQSLTWQNLADEDLRRARDASRWHSDPRQLSVYTWGVPPQEVIDQAVKLRLRLDAQLPSLEADAARILLVVGNALSTPAGVRLGEAGVEYLDAPQHGDGRVTLDSACLPGVRTWRVDASHGDLPKTRSAFVAYQQLLENGTTNLLDGLGGPSDARGGSASRPVPAMPQLQPSRPSRERPSTAEPPSSIDGVFSPSTAEPVAGSGAAAVPALRLTVLNGNLKFISQPLMLGHYRSLALTGTEHVMDGLLGGQMRRSLAAGLYATAPGASQIFVNRQGREDNPFALPRPAAVIIAGLGDEGKLRSRDLADTVRQAAIAYAQRVAEQQGEASNGFELVAVLIGSGGSGITPGSSAHAVASGVRAANERLAAEDCGWPIATRLTLVELYLDRATEAHQSLRMLAAGRAGAFALDPQIVHGIGPLRRPAGFGYRGAQYDFISVSQSLDADQQPVIAFTVDSQRARDEVREQGTQSRLVDELLRVGADDRNRDQRIGRSLFKLLVPLRLEPLLAGSESVVLQVDPEVARIPWEMLDTASAEDDAVAQDPRPWAVRTHMIRKLRLKEGFREDPHMARGEMASLVIGEPKCDLSIYPELPAAASEAREVARVLGVKELIGGDTLSVINALLERPYRIVHIAGHGKLPDDIDTLTGVVLDNGAVLGPREIKSLRTVPELVFVNCCHLGNITADSQMKRNALGDGRPLFAASVAQQLIDIGVRCVVAAGWAVEDEAAMQFATRFYAALLQGRRFIDAVGAARQAAWEAHREGNTWAAYQCYGDPEWTLTLGEEAAPVSAAERLSRLGIVSSVGLATELETIATKCRFDGIDDATRAQALADVQQIEAAFEAVWGRQGAVAEAFGLAYAETGDRDASIRWYEIALAAEDGSASVRATEQLANQLARRGRRDEIGRAIAILQGLVAMKPTSERYNLLGSAFKRLALLEDTAEPRQAKAWSAAIAAMAENYRLAQRIVEDQGGDNLFYPAMNRMGAELVLNAGIDGWEGFDAAELAAVRQSISRRLEADPDFWSVVGAIEFDLYEAVAGRRLALAWPDIAARLTDVHARVPGGRGWDSVCTQAVFALGPYGLREGLPEAEAGAMKALLALLERFKGNAA